MRRHDLSDAERRRILEALSDELRGTQGLRLVFAFGSFVRGEPFRDLDLAVLFDDPRDWRGIGRVEGRASEALGELDVPIDIVPLNDASPAFRREVVREGRLLWEREPGTAREFEVQSVSEDMDYRAFRRAHGLGL